MKKNLSRITAVMLSAAAAFTLPFYAYRGQEIKADAEKQVTAFPGAVGGGKYATGGRGGSVVHVTNLNDSGEGSFRDAVSHPGRIVVFDVSGTIELKSNILVSDNITIAGQTAPGGSGITLKNYKLGMSGDNIICRYISSRPGPYAATSSGNDAWGGAKGSGSVIDHCSMSWTTDEQWGLYSNNEYYTVQYSVIGPADSWGGHSKGIHGFGLMMGKGYSTFDHNLIVHNVSRNFRGKVSGTETADFTNNVIYNWAYQTAYGTIGHLNYTNNTLKMGNGTTGGKHYVDVDSSTKPENFGIYLKGNRMLNKDGSVYPDVTADNWNGITVKDGLGITKDSLRSETAFQTVVNGENVSTADTCESAEASYDHVLSFAGNGISPDLRTAADRQAAYEAMTGTGNLSGTAAYEDADSSQKANLDKYGIQCGTVYEYPAAVTEKSITDTDNDGMPDDWETARGLDPDDAGDTNGDYCGRGYTNIEYYINDLTVNSFPEGIVEISPEQEYEKISAYDMIEAESFSGQEGVQVEDCEAGGQNVGYIENGDYIMFRNVDFEDGAKSFEITAAGGEASVGIFLDSPDGEPVATVSAGGTDGWQTWETFDRNIPTISGTHDLYLKFTGGEGFLINVDRFTFSKQRVPLNGRLIKDLYVNDDANILSWGIADNAAAGDTVFGDREFTYLTLPDELTGSEKLLTACDSKFSAGTLATFTAGDDIDIYVGFDTRVETLPEWMSGWEETGLSATTDNEVTFSFLKKSVPSGETVELGENGQSAYCVNYVVLVKEKSAEVTTEETTAEITEQTTETTGTTGGEDDIFWGDANEDRVILVSDAVLILSYTVDPATADITERGIRNADVYQNGDGVNSSDAASVQKFIAKILAELPESYMTGMTGETA